MKASNILETIGNTPHIRVNRLFGTSHNVYIKSERANPGGSIKDRIAVSMVDGPDAGLAAVGALEAEGRLAGYRYLPAAKADMLRRLGRRDEAAAAYRAALGLADNDAERAFLERRLDALTSRTR